jgi:hypothetical protein
MMSLNTIELVTAHQAELRRQASIAHEDRVLVAAGTRPRLRIRLRIPSLLRGRGIRPTRGWGLRHDRRSMTSQRNGPPLLPDIAPGRAES